MGSIRLLSLFSTLFSILLILLGLFLLQKSPKIEYKHKQVTFSTAGVHNTSSFAFVYVFKSLNDPHSIFDRISFSRLLVSVKSLLETGTDHQVVVLSNSWTGEYKEMFSRCFGERVQVREMEDANVTEGKWVSFTTYGNWKMAWFKLLIFKLFEYKKIVFLDADTLVLKDISELFLSSESLYGALDLADLPFKCKQKNVFGKKNLNSGLLVASPSPQKFSEILSKLKELPPQNGDQKFLQMVFPDFSVLPVCYGYIYELCNCASVVPFESVKTVHFTSSSPVYQYLGVVEGSQLSDAQNCFIKIAKRWYDTAKRLEIVRNGEYYINSDLSLRLDTPANRKTE